MLTKTKGALKMNIKNNIERLLKLETNYKIWQETGIAQTTLGDYTKGKSKVGNMKLDHAIKLNDYYKNNKEMLEMKELNFSGMEYNDKQVDVVLQVDDFEEVFAAYNRISGKDEEFFAKELGDGLEEAIEEDYDTISVCFKHEYNNECISFNYEVLDDDFEVVASIKLHDTWQEDR